MTAWKFYGDPAQRDYSCSVFEVQAKYPDGWKTLERVSPWTADQDFAAAKRRWSSFKLRLTQDGRRIR